MEIAVLIMFYDEIDCLKRLIPNLKNSGVKNIIAVDGTYVDYPHNGEKSTDGSREYLESEGIKIIDAGISEFLIDKQNKALNYGYDNFKSFIIMDSDEYVVGEWKYLEKSLDEIHRHINMPIYNICLFDTTGEYTNRSFGQRLFVKNGIKLKYESRHWMLYHDNVRINPTHVIGGISFFHDDSIRPTERDNKMKSFQQINLPKEKSVAIK